MSSRLAWSAFPTVTRTRSWSRCWSFTQPRGPTRGRSSPSAASGSPATRSRPGSSSARPRSYLARRPARFTSLGSGRSSCELGDGCEVLDDREARAGQLLALGDHVRPKELLMIGMLVEVVRGQDGGQDGHLGLEGCLHDALQDGLRDEFMPVDPAVDHESARADRRVLARLGELLGHERDLQAARGREELDATLVVPAPGELRDERLLAAVGDVRVPRGLDVGDLRLASHGPLSCRRGSLQRARSTSILARSLRYPRVRGEPPSRFSRFPAQPCGPARSTRPGSAPVCCPWSNTTLPPTMT